MRPTSDCDGYPPATKGSRIAPHPCRAESLFYNPLRDLFRRDLPHSDIIVGDARLFTGPHGVGWNKVTVQRGCQKLTATGLPSHKSKLAILPAILTHL
jgi:hypothetical protein